MLRRGYSRPRQAMAGLVAAALLTNLLAACAAASAWDIDPNTIESSISLERARSLAPYDVCLPSWLPPGVVSVPVLTYRDEREGPGGPRMYVALDAEYFDDAGDRVLELRESGPGDGAYSGGRAGYRYGDRELLRQLLAWRVNRDWDQGEAIEASLVWTGSTHQKGERTCRAVAIALPDGLRASLVEWRQGDVDNTLFSLLPLTTTLDVAFSVCESGEAPGE